MSHHNKNILHVINYTAKSYEVLVNLLSQRLNVQTFYLSYSHGGLFGIYTSAPASEANKQIQTAVEELKKIATSANGIDSVKNQVYITIQQLLLQC